MSIMERWLGGEGADGRRGVTGVENRGRLDATGLGT